MFQWFLQQDPVIQALCATLFTWLMTVLGAGVIFLFSSVNRKILDMMLGFAAGVMIAASFWSLLDPAIAMAAETMERPWIPAAVGFLAGGIFLALVDRVIPHLHLGFPSSEVEGIPTSWRRSVLLVSAITIHNIPEGLAVGVAFGALAYDLPGASLAGALSLALGVGIQNFPEGLAVSAPLYREGLSKGKSFFYGQISGIVEPIAGVLGALAVIVMKPLLPYALAFAAGAMIFVVVEELIPESQLGNSTDLATMGTIVGFVVMMVLDVGLG